MLIRDKEATGDETFVCILSARYFSILFYTDVVIQNVLLYEVVTANVAIHEQVCFMAVRVIKVPSVAKYLIYCISTEQTFPSGYFITLIHL